MKNSFKQWLKFEAKYIHYDIYYGIRNLIRWFPVIFRDSSFGGHDTFEILKTKLEFLMKDSLKSDLFADTKRDGERMKLSIRLIEKIQAEYYGMEYISDEEWSNADESYFDNWFLNRQIGHMSYIKKYPLIYKRIISNPSKAPYGIDSPNSVALSIGQINENRARKLLFKILEEHIQGWGN